MLPINFGGKFGGNDFFFGGKSPINFHSLSNNLFMKPTNRLTELSIKQLVPFAIDKRIGSGSREYELPSINECRFFFAEKYSLDTDIFEIG